MEQALWDRLSFRRFVGLGLDEDAPDRSTISRFRRTLARRGLARPLFAALNRQFEAQALVLKQGTLLDATLVEAQVRRSGCGTGAGARSERDPDASWTRKGGRSSFGYQGHLGVDQGSGLVRRAELQPAHVNETEVAEGLIVGDEQAVYADRAYEDKVRRRRLRAAGVKDRIKHRRHKYLARLPHWQRRRNELIERRRAAVERVFGTLKQHYGYRRVRYRGLERNTLELLFKCIAYNLRRADTAAQPRARLNTRRLSPRRPERAARAHRRRTPHPAPSAARPSNRATPQSGPPTTGRSPANQHHHDLRAGLRGGESGEGGAVGGKRGASPLCPLPAQGQAAASPPAERIERSTESDPDPDSADHSMWSPGGGGEGKWGLRAGLRGGREWRGWCEGEGDAWL